jgi:hypothetical protein
MTVQLSAEQVLDEHSLASVLSIDFFDTLITRSVAQPTHIFAVMEQEQREARRGVDLLLPEWNLNFSPGKESKALTNIAM